MKKWKRKLKRTAAIALAVLMVSNTIDMSAFAVSTAEETQVDSCEHHTEHTAECGYVEAVEGSLCSHEHDELCGYNTVSGNEICSHEHDDTCGYAEAVEGTPCIYACEECSQENTGNLDANNPGNVEQLEEVQTIDEAVENVRALINALPEAEALTSMSVSEQGEVYNELLTADEAYQALTEEQKAQLIEENVKLDELFAYFSSPQMAAPAEDTSTASTISLRVNGVHVTNLQGSTEGYTLDDPSAGWSYAPSTSTLTLTNAVFTNEDSSYGAAIYWTGGDLTIELVGTNTVDVDCKYPIFFKADTDDRTLTIKGPGSLNVGGGIYHEYSTGKGMIVITDGATVNATEISGLGNVTITDSTVIADGSGWAGIYSEAEVTIANSYVVAKSGDGSGIQVRDNLTITNSQVEVAGSQSDIANALEKDLSDSIVTTSTETTVYGTATLKEELTVASGETINFETDASITNTDKLTVEAGATVKENGTVHTHNTDGKVTYTYADGTNHTKKAVCNDCPVGHVTETNEAHSGGTATCTKGKICEFCSEEYGEPAEHKDMKFSAVGTTITATCGVCGTEMGSITLNAPDADRLTYDGLAKEATLSGSIDGVDTPTITYNTDDGNAPVNAGNYTASITIVDGEGTQSTASTDFTINKVTPNIGTVSANPLEDTLDVGEVSLSRTNENPAGTLELTDDTLQYGTHTYNWKFTPDDTANYNTITGTVDITVSDTKAPTATYQIGTDGWKQFINTITFGSFCKDYKTVEISYSDEGSGVANKQYYISSKELENTGSVEWKDYTGTISLNAEGTYFIYVKAADNYGNEVILNSEGIVIYAESIISLAAFDYVYKENSDRIVQITMNGNTFARLTDGEGNEITTDKYTMDEAGKFTLKAAYLDTLDKGEYTYKIYMNPQGVETTEVTLAYSFTVNVTARELTVTGAITTNREYDGTNVVKITDIPLDGIKDNDSVTVDLIDVQGTLSSANVGDYTSVTLPALILTGTDAGNYRLIQPTEAVTTNVTISKASATIPADIHTSLPAQAVGKTVNITVYACDADKKIYPNKVQINVTTGNNSETSIGQISLTSSLAGTYKGTYVIPQDKGLQAGDVLTFTVSAEHENYILSVVAVTSITVSEQEKTALPAPPADTLDDGTVREYKLEAETDITSVPESLKNNYGSVDELKQDMKVKAQAALTDAPKDNIAFYELTLWYSENGGKSWIKADSSHFPKSGVIPITLDYPTGINQSNAKQYTFKLIHMFTTDVNNKQPGTIETLTPSATVNGLKTEVTGLSPFVLIWKENPVSSNNGSTSGNETKNNESNDTKEFIGAYDTANTNVESKTANVPTGDTSNLYLWIVLLVFCGTGIAVIFFKKKKSNL